MKPSSKIIASKAKGSSAPRARCVAVPDTTHASVSVRKIDNGFIVSESRDGPKGYSYTERYSPTKPKITMPSAAPAKGKK